MGAYDALTNQQGYNYLMMQQQAMTQYQSGMLGGQLGSGYANGAGCISGTITAEALSSSAGLAKIITAQPQSQFAKLVDPRTAVQWLDSELERVRIRL